MPYRQVTLEERRTLFRLLHAQVPVAEIASQLGRHRSTIFRELRRNPFREVKEYRGCFPVTADDSAKRRRQRRRKLIQDARLRQHVTAMLAQWWSPEQIAGRLRSWTICSMRKVDLSRQAAKFLRQVPPKHGRQLAAKIVRRQRP